ncbi:hypothetical protein T265_14806, partial [Opisthorchis viverrini]
MSSESVQFSRAKSQQEIVSNVEYIRPLSEDERYLLEKGLSFPVSKKVVRAGGIIPSIESVFQKLPSVEAEKLRIQLVTVLKSQQPGTPNIAPSERRALNTLRQVDSIVITKGKATVVMNKSNYLQKVKQHLADGPYRQITGSSITSIMNKRKVEVGRCLRSVINHLGQGKWYRLYPKSAIQPRLYGLPKIHKADVPIRPIVDGIGSPPHELARFLASILKPLTGKSSTFIRNSYDFANKVAGLPLEMDEVLVSFDVISMYTNIPRADALEVTKRLLLADTTLGERTQLSVDEIVEGIRVCLNLDKFVFDTTVYSQEQGLAMGSPISPVLANIYMEDFEQIALAGYHCPPNVFWRYVDDTFVVIKRDNVNSFHDYLNSLNPHIKFSMEIESTSGTLPFLDCITHKVGGKLKTTVYQKPTDTGTVLSYSSAHPKSVYASIVSSMFRRVRALCTEEIDRTAAQIEIANKLQEIGYP